MTEELTIEIDPSALEAVPIFPLPGTVLLPQTLVSLHVFEPRYRKMMAYCLEEHRVMAVALLHERGEPDAFGRPPIHGMAGLGYVRRSARLPDGRYNIVLEGVARLDVSREHPPETPFRRAQGLLIEPDPVTESASTVQSAGHALRALCSRVFSAPGQTETLEELFRLPPGQLADTVAASAIEDPQERQRVLETVDVQERVELVSGALGALILGSAARRIRSVRCLPRDPGGG
ncbi:MAG: LON peptidase substrate-binding domain-containing protein, partial [Myxococcota bacterium]